MKKLLLLPLLAIIFACGTNENEFTKLKISSGPIDNLRSMELESTFILDGPDELGFYKIKDMNDSINVMFDINPDGSTTMVNATSYNEAPKEWRTKNGNFIYSIISRDSITLLLYENNDIKEGVFLLYTK